MCAISCAQQFPVAAYSLQWFVGSLNMQSVNKNVKTTALNRPAPNPASPTLPKVTLRREQKTNAMIKSFQLLLFALDVSLSVLHALVLHSQPNLNGTRLIQVPCTAQAALCRSPGKRILPAPALSFQEEITVSWIINENKLPNIKYWEGNVYMLTIKMPSEALTCLKERTC